MLIHQSVMYSNIYLLGVKDEGTSCAMRLGGGKLGSERAGGGGGRGGGGSREDGAGRLSGSGDGNIPAYIERNQWIACPCW